LAHIASFTTNQLQHLIENISSSNTVGTDALWQIVIFATSAMAEIEDEAKRLVLWALKEKLESICQCFESEPMDVKTSANLVRNLNFLTRDLFTFLEAQSIDCRKAVMLCISIMNIDDSSRSRLSVE